MKTNDEMTIEQFDVLTKNSKVCVFDFSATWCAPCRMFAPVVEEAEEKFSQVASFFKVDIDRSEELAINKGITAVPTVVVTVDGKEAGRTSGYQSIEEFEQFLNKTIKK